MGQAPNLNSVIASEEEATFVGVSELRNQPDRIFKEMRERLVVIEKHHKPVAVLLPIEKYESLERLLDLVEEYVLGVLASEREEKNKNPNWVSLEKALRRVGLGQARGQAPD